MPSVVTAVPDTYSVQQGQQIQIADPGVLGNDYGGNGNPLTAQLVASTSNGELNLYATGGLFYQPLPGFVGTDSFSYYATDGTDNSNTVDVTINVVDNPPVGNPDTYEIHQGLTLNVPVDTGVLANDSDPDSVDTLTAVNFTQPANGTLNPNLDGSFSYTPAAGFVGIDSFTYKASDGALTSDPVNVTISVTNTDPTGTDDSYVVHEGDTLFVSAPGVLVNDFDQDGDYLSAVLVSQPAYGGFDFSDDGSFDYTPEPGTEGTTVSFTYRAWDGAALSGLLTVSINVQAAQAQTTFTVNTTDDTQDANPGNGVAEDGNGKTSLRAAIEEANAEQTDDGFVINFAQGLTGQTISLGIALPAINKDMSINGLGRTDLTIQRNPNVGNFRVFQINADKLVSINNLTIANGAAIGTNYLNPAGWGGGIHNAGILGLWNVDLTGNSATYGGGAVYNDAGANLTLEDTNISDNQAASGGGIVNFGEALIDGGSLDDNTATGGIGTGGGGAVLNAQFATFYIYGADIHANQAWWGGGISNQGQLTVQGGIIHINDAAVHGGGVTNTGRASLSDVSIEYNRALDNTIGYGGGVYVEAGTVTLFRGMVDGNTAAVRGNGGAWTKNSGTLNRDNTQTGQTPPQDFYEYDPNA